MAEAKSGSTDRLDEEYFSVAQSEWSRLLGVMDVIHAGILRAADLVTDLKHAPFLAVECRMLAVIQTADLIDCLTVRPDTRQSVTSLFDLAFR